MRHLFLAFGALACSISCAGAYPEGNVAAGKVIYDAKCSSCHGINENRSGPMLVDIVGRPVAALTSYEYSAAFTKIGDFWSPCRLDLFLQNPQAAAPGDYRVYSNNVEVGAGWIKKGKTSGEDYVSLSFSDPSFGPKKLYANLGHAAGQDDENVFATIWNPAD